jgi:hypothetical protein
VFSKLGSYYAKMPDSGKSLFATGEEPKRGKGTRLTWLRAYVSTGAPEQYHLEGIIWETSKQEE